MEREDIEAAFIKRIDEGPFTFAQLHGVSSDHRSYRMADRLIQKLRKDGKISGKRVGRNFVWEKVAP